MTIGRTAPGPIEAETPAERATKRQTRDRRCDIARRNASDEENLASLGERPPGARHLIQKIVGCNETKVVRLTKDSCTWLSHFDLKGAILRHPAMMSV